MNGDARSRTARTIEERRLARRAAVFGPSVWNEAYEIVDRFEDVIYFGNGAPAKEIHPIGRLQDAAAVAWSSALDALDYGEVAGYGPLRELISDRMAAQGITADPGHIMLTSGSQQGIDYVARLMIDPGDTIVVEGPTYIGAMQAFDAYEPTYLTVPVDEHGMDVAELARALDRADRKPKFIYTIPTFQNPTGITMTRARREALLELSRERGLLILEDDPYGEIYFGDRPEVALRALDENVIYLGTFSKTIAPGIRMGWLVAPDDLIDMLLMVKEAADIHGDRLIMRTVYHTAKDFLDGHVERARAVYRARRDAVIETLEEFMPPGVTWSHPEGGFFIWVTLPEGFSAYELLPFAAERGVAFLPGAWFYPRGHEVWNSLRISFSTHSEETIREGVRRLGRAVTEFTSR
ncbi:MAG: PLP-dependent aminotransferase family protein [Thermomicrobiales bacterium]|nr:PLP-dependent aminotransferase family protein [Thermomicrobiales bacterium]